MSAQVFISHASSDQKVARAICTALEKHGLSCWLASRDVRPGENFQEAIVKAIRSARVMVLVFTDGANNSDEIKKELALASQNRLTVIPARAEDVVPNAALAYEFATRQWIDLFADWEHGTEQLSTWVASILHGEPGAPPRPAAVAASRPASQDPLHHFVGALLFVVAALLLVFIAPNVTAWGNSGGDGLRLEEALSPYHVCSDPMSIRARTGGCSTVNWPAIAIFLATIAVLLVAGFGTILRKYWARYLGGGLCIAGIALGGYIAFEHASLSYSQFTYDPSRGTWRRVAGLDDAIETHMAPAANLFIALSASVFVLVFALAAAVYIWRWQKRSTTIPSEHRVTNFSLALALVCVLAVGMLYAYQVTLNDEGWLRVSSLAVVEVIVFTWCFIRFRREFDPA